MLDFVVQKFTRICAKTDAELKPGETFYSILVREGGETVRRDVSAKAWEGPPEDCVGWWKSEVPDPKSNKLNWAPNDVMLHYFADTEDKPDQADLRYVLALLMIRRRIFRLEETRTNEAGEEVLALFCSKNETEYEVPVLDVSASRAAELQATVSELLVDVGK